MKTRSINASIILHRRMLLSTIAIVCGVVVSAAPARGEGLRGDHASDREVSPELAGFNPARFALVDSVIRNAIADGASPGVALAVGRHGKLVRLRGYGRTDWNPFAPDVTDSTVYDLASLTKAMGTATVAAQLVSEGRLQLNTPIHRYLANWPSRGMHGQITVRHLLAHTSGLPAGYDIWAGDRTRDQRIAALAKLKVYSRPGTARTYSDVGMILLGAIIEEVMGARLDAVLATRLFTPLAMRDTRFNPLRFETTGNPLSLAVIAPTELDTYVRRSLVHGVVHDLNAWALDGVAGHAGLFSSARDMATYAQSILDAANGVDTPLFPGGSFASWVEERSFGRPLGWDIPTGPTSSAGKYFSSASIGHTGFTGTSMWIDPKRDVFVVLLTNRLNPSASNQKHLQLRRDVHDLVQLAIADMVVTPRD